MSDHKRHDWVADQLRARRASEDFNPEIKSLIKDGATPPEILEHFTILAKKENLTDDRSTEQRDSGTSPKSE